MLSDQAYMALRDLESGAVMNPVHTTARELINEGLACNDWGHLALTEAGRRAARQGASRRFEIEDPEISNLWIHVDPRPVMPAPSPPPPVPPVKLEVPVLSEEPPPAPPETLPVDEVTRAQRAAGVATGKTGIEVEVKWVHAFIDAWVHE